MKIFGLFDTESSELQPLVTFKGDYIHQNPNTHFTEVRQNPKAAYGPNIIVAIINLAPRQYIKQTGEKE